MARTAQCKQSLNLGRTPGQNEVHFLEPVVSQPVQLFASNFQPFLSYAKVFIESENNVWLNVKNKQITNKLNFYYPSHMINVETIFGIALAKIERSESVRFCRLYEQRIFA